MPRRVEPKPGGDGEPQDPGEGFEGGPEVPDFGAEAPQPDTTPDEEAAKLDAEWQKVRDRVMGEISASHRVVTLRPGDEKFGDRVDVLREALSHQFGATLEIADPAGEDKPEMDIFFERLNRQLNAMQQDWEVESWRDIDGEVELGLRAGDRNKFISVGGGKMQMRVEDALVDYLQREAGEGASLEITGGHVAPGTTSAEFFGSENKDEVEAALEQAFVDLMSRTTGKICERLVGIFRKRPIDRRSTFKAGIFGFERKQGVSVAKELYPVTDEVKQYLVYEGDKMEIVTSADLRKRFSSDAFSARNKTEDCGRKIQSGLLASGGRIFLIA